MSGLNLSDSEKKLILKFETDNKASVIRYIIGGTLIVISIYLFVQKGNENNHVAVLYGILGGVFIVIQYSYNIYFRIIKKTKNYIQEIEAKST